MKLEIPVKADFDDIQDMIDEIKRLQTYKLFEGDDMVLVDLDAVVAVMANHVKADKCSESQNSWIPVSKELPFAQPRKKGKWIERDDCWDGIYYECSVCKYSFSSMEGTPSDNDYDFCPNCGCQMSVGEQE